MDVNNTNMSVCTEFEKLSRQTLKAFNSTAPTRQEATKVYDQYYKLWAQFRRTFRHELFVVVDGKDSVCIVEVDNLYLTKKSVGKKELLWSYGVQHIKPSELSPWTPGTEPPQWTSYEWDWFYRVGDFN